MKKYEVKHPALVYLDTYITDLELKQKLTFKFRSFSLQFNIISSLDLEESLLDFFTVHSSHDLKLDTFVKEFLSKFNTISDPILESFFMVLSSLDIPSYLLSPLPYDSNLLHLLCNIYVSRINPRYIDYNKIKSVFIAKSPEIDSFSSFLNLLLIVNPKSPIENLWILLTLKECNPNLSLSKADFIALVKHSFVNRYVLSSFDKAVILSQFPNLRFNYLRFDPFEITINFLKILFPEHALNIESLEGITHLLNEED